MSSLKFLSNFRYIASPFASVQDLSWRLLIRKLGVHLCFADVVKAFDNPIQDATSIRDDLFGISTVKREDQPLIVQVRDLHNLNAFKFEKHRGWEGFYLSFPVWYFYPANFTQDHSRAPPISFGEYMIRLVGTKCKRNVNVICLPPRVFTQGAPRSSQELVQKCPCIPGSNWNLEMLVLQERGKPEYPEKNLSEQRREPTTNSTHIWRRVWELNLQHVGGSWALSPLCHPCSQDIETTGWEESHH